MVSALISRLVILVFGTLYPAYASYKAVKTKDVKEYVKWMMYWIVFALFTSVETFADVLVSWMPFYYELKIIFVVWLLSPATNGSSILYRKFVHPELMRREQHIDDCLDKVKTQGYTALVNVSTQGLNYAIQTALSGQAKIVDHLRKSYSMNDLSRPALAASRPFVPAEPRIREVDSEEDVPDAGEIASMTARERQGGQRHVQQQHRARQAAAHHETDEEEEERYLHERLAEDNQFLAAAGVPAASTSATLVHYGSLAGYNLRSQQNLTSSSSSVVNVAGPGRRSAAAGTVGAAQQQQMTEPPERPYVHEESYHYGTLPRRRVLASPAAGQRQLRGSSRPALPSEWHS